MSNLTLQGGNKWDASGVYDVTQAKGQDQLNAVTGALDALKVVGNNDKVLCIKNGAFAAETLEAWTGGSY